MTEPRAYLDYNATAPLRPEARDAMVAALDVSGNASSVHEEGRAVRALIEDARETIAAAIGARVSEVVFTNGATESNNWFAKAGWDLIYVPDIEHASVVDAVKASGCEIRTFGTGVNGVAHVEAFAADVLKSGYLPEKTAVTLQSANNETGVVQPVAELAAFAREHEIFVHSDGVQALGRLPLNFDDLGVDSLSLTAHKIGGPKGVGCLVIRDGVTLPALLHGGGQERRRRAGTENIAAIAGFAAAVRAAQRDLADMARLQMLRDRIEAGVNEITPGATVFGQTAERLANTSCFAVEGKRAETLLIKLDLAGVAVSTGAACSSGKVGASQVLEAMHVAPELAAAAIRVSLGHATTEADIEKFLRAWKVIHASDRLAA